MSYESCQQRSLRASLLLISLDMEAIHAEFLCKWATASSQREAEKLAVWIDKKLQNMNLWHQDIERKLANIKALDELIKYDFDGTPAT
jgi:hypothetical protein